MSPVDEFFANRPPPPTPPGRRDVVFLIVLLGLLALGALLWLLDPAHQSDGKSRVDWPDAPAPAKP